MALNLMKFSSRIALNAARLNCVRLISTQNTVRIMSVNNGTSLLKSVIDSSSNKSLVRYYSSDNKLNKTQIEERVLDILKNFDRIKENPNKPTITIESHLAKDLGLDSLDHVEIIVQLEEAFGYEIPDSDYEKLYTPKEIVNYIEKRIATI